MKFYFYIMLFLYHIIISFISSYYIICINFRQIKTQTLQSCMQLT